MSMLCTLSRVTPAQMDAMRDDPLIVENLLHNSAALPPPAPGLLQKLFVKKPKAMPQPGPQIAWIGAEQQVDVDKQWHILHFLLTGEIEGGAFPACFLCSAGDEVGVDLGYGRPRLFSSEQARAIAGHLASIDEAWLLERYQADRITAHEVYWQAATSEEARRDDVQALHATIRELTGFIGDTARMECGLVVEIY